MSVLLPTHNRADVLGHAIQSVLWQTEADFELLIVLDGCTDHTREVIAGFHDPRIRIFDLPKAPLSGYANRNVALRQARGRYVAYAQHDDIWFPDHIARLLATLEASGAEWGYTRPLWCTPDGFVLPFAVNLTKADELAYYLAVENNVPSCCVMHTRNALARVGFWPEDVEHEADWLCWRRILESGRNAGPGYAPVPTTLHFRAAWRTQDHPAAVRLRRIANGAAWWPAECRLSVPHGTAEQTVFFEVLSSGVNIAALRAGVSTILDRLAWSSALPAAKTWRDDRPGVGALKRVYEAFRRRWNSPSAPARQPGAAMGGRRKKRERSKL